MITVYKKDVLPDNAEIIRVNDVFFNKFTSVLIDDRARDIIQKIDNSEMISKYYIASRFDGSRINVDMLSTGCKCALNIMYNPDRIFDIRECGENALEVIYSFDAGQVYCDYPMIAFDMTGAKAFDTDDVHIFSDYDELREWWMS